MSVIELQKAVSQSIKTQKRNTANLQKSFKFCDVIRLISKLYKCYVHRSKACIHLPCISKFRKLISNQHYLPTRNMKSDWHTCSSTVILHTQKNVTLSLTNVEGVKRHMKVSTTSSNPFNSKDSLYFPSAQLSSVLFNAITIHSPSMTVKKKKIIMRSYLSLKWLKERAKNLPLLSIKRVKLKQFYFFFTLQTYKL